MKPFWRTVTMRRLCLSVAMVMFGVIAIFGCGFSVSPPESAASSPAKPVAVNVPAPQPAPTSIRSVKHIHPHAAIEDKQQRFDWIYPIPTARPDGKNVQWQAINSQGVLQVGLPYPNVSWGIHGPTSTWGQGQSLGQQGLLLHSPERWVMLSGSQLISFDPPASRVEGVTNLGQSLFAIHQFERSDPKLPFGGGESHRSPFCPDMLYDPYEMWHAPADIVPRDFFQEGLIVVSRGSKFGYADRQGQLVIEPIYENALHFSNGMAAVMLNGSWGYIDATGTMRIEPQYTEAHPFDEGIAMVVGEGQDQRFLIDIDGTHLRDVDHGGYSLMHEGRAPCRVDDKLGFVNPEGEWSIEPAYRYVGAFQNGIAFVTHTDPHLSGIINRTGHLLQPLPDLAKSTYFQGNLAWVEINNGPIGYLRRDGFWIWQLPHTAHLN
ncbi:WG repeat-containing protein [Bremerella cremea]|uniref:WG repeat-containing protein n=1 Tax=Bremerella cremea TaxID=1031537 RepID=UPI0031E4EBB4